MKSSICSDHEHLYVMMVTNYASSSYQSVGSRMTLSHLHSLSSDRQIERVRKMKRVINARVPATSDKIVQRRAPIFIGMWSFFHTKVDDVVLFEGWKIDEAGTMALACVITILIGIGFEFVKWARKRAIADLKLRQNPNASPTPLQALFSATHLVGTLFFALQLSIGYLLMLLVMTFSVWLGLSVVVGATLGFIIFGDRD